MSKPSCKVENILLRHTYVSWYLIYYNSGVQFNDIKFALYHHKEISKLGVICQPMQWNILFSYPDSV